MASRLFQAYNGALARRPLLVQSATAASLYAVGDVIAQGTPAGIGTDKSWKWDWQRTLRMTAIGGLALGPTMALWHALQDVEINLASHTRSVVARVLADQIVFALVSIVGLYYMTELLQPDTGTIRERAQIAQEKIKTSFTHVLTRNYTLWPAVSYLNFFYVPLQYRLLVSNTVAIFWSAYLSFSVNKSDVEVEELAHA